MITSDQVVEAARKYIGTPVIEGGRSTEGADCVGLVLGVGHELGLMCPDDVQGYGLNPWLHPRTSAAREMMNEYMVQVESPRPGDVVLFALGRIAISVGVVTEVESGVIKRLISGLEVGTRFTECPFVPEKTHAIAACFRFRELMKPPIGNLGD